MYNDGIRTYCYFVVDENILATTRLDAKKMCVAYDSSAQLAVVNTVGKFAAVKQALAGVASQ